MKKPTNKQIVDVLTKAKPLLASNLDDLYVTRKRQFICHAIVVSDCGHILDDPSKVATWVIKKVVEARLEGCVTVEDWLGEKHKLYLEFDDRQKYRHMWLNMLIEEFSK